jgi:hypothetical protein
MRAIAAAAVLFVLVPACSFASTDAEPPTTTQPEASASARTTTEAEAPGRVTAGAWRARYSLWMTDLRVALENAGTLRHVRGRPVAPARLSADDRERYDGALAELRDCRARLDELGEPPGRFARPVGILGRACDAFAAGAELAAGDVPYARAFARWGEGAELVRRANAALPKPDSIERLPVPVSGGMIDGTRIEPLFSEIANDLAAPAAQIRCWAEPEWTRVKKQLFGKNLDIAGFAYHETKRAGLSAEICRWLALLAYTEERPTGSDQLEVAFAVNVLMHESGHLNETGDFFGAGQNEPLAECWAIQHIRPAARRLGASREYASTLAERYWTEVYPHLGPGYRTPRCGNGGPYDERPGTDAWP